MFVQAIQHRQGYRIACLEEIAHANGWIGPAELEKAAAAHGSSEYGEYLRELIRGLP
jgi:glucose-1-phosphate thymidylyltransferase